MVRPEGLEPPQVTPTDPKSVASTNSAMAADQILYSGQGGGRQGIREALIPASMSQYARLGRPADSAVFEPLAGAEH